MSDTTEGNGWPPEVKQRLLERVAAWIDEVEEAEPLPEGLSEEALAAAPTAVPVEPDLLTLHSQLAALTQETRLLGRATSRLTTESKEAIEQLESRTTGGATVEALSRARREARMEQASELLDVRDRLVRGLDQARSRLAAISSWRRRLLGGADLLEALVRGNELTLERLDDLLRRLSLQEVPSEGRPFDPATMRAVERAVRDGVAPGTVLDVFRSGWLSGETVVRFAEVRVAASAPSPIAGKR